METRQDLTQSTGVPVDQAAQNYTKRTPDSIQGVFIWKGENHLIGLDRNSWGTFWE